MPNNQLRFIRSILYALERDYGQPLDIYRSTSTMDVTTGKKTVGITKYSIKRAVILPSDLERKYNYDHSYVAADKQFTYGGLFDVKQVTVLINNIRLPAGFEITENDYAIYQKERYQFKKITAAEHGFATLIVMRAVKGQPAGQIIDVVAFNKFRLTQEVLKT